MQVVRIRKSQTATLKALTKPDVIVKYSKSGALTLDANLDSNNRFTIGNDVNNNLIVTKLNAMNNESSALAFSCFDDQFWREFELHLTFPIGKMPDTKAAPQPKKEQPPAKKKRKKRRTPAQMKKFREEQEKKKKEKLEAKQAKIKKEMEAKKKKEMELKQKDEKPEILHGQQVITHNQ